MKIIKVLKGKDQYEGLFLFACGFSFAFPSQDDCNKDSGRKDPVCGHEIEVELITYFQQSPQTIVPEYFDK